VETQSVSLGENSREEIRNGNGDGTKHVFKPSQGTKLAGENMNSKKASKSSRKNHFPGNSSPRESRKRREGKKRVRFFLQRGRDKDEIKSSEEGKKVQTDDLKRKPVRSGKLQGQEADGRADLGKNGPASMRTNAKLGMGRENSSREDRGKNSD